MAFDGAIHGSEKVAVALHITFSIIGKPELSIFLSRVSESSKNVQISIPQLSTTIVFCTWSDPSLDTKHEPLESLPICNLIQAQIKKEPRWIEPFWMEMKVSFSPSVHITNNSLVFHPNTVWILAY